MKDIQKVLDELPFPAVGFQEDGTIVQNQLAVQAKVIAWLEDKPPEPIRRFMSDEAHKISRVHCKVDGKQVVASGRWLSCGVSKILRLIPRL